MRISDWSPDVCSSDLLDMEAGMKSLHIPYKGSAPATSDILGGQTNAILDNMVTLVPHINSGKLVPLAVTSEERVSILPNVPTVNESGVPGFRSEEHTSELQSLMRISYAVFCLKKK